jgi:ribonuclease J
MSTLRLIPLGGMGNVTQNMYVYEYEDELLLVDCGIGFPDMYMPGVDILIPDISYVMKKLDEGKRIAGMILTHGHDDHIAALPYILPRLPEFPIYASALTAGFARNRISESEAADRPITEVVDLEPFQIGQYFTGKAFAMTHSVPDTKHYTIITPAGTIYHGADFKLDPTPVDGVTPDFEHISQLKNDNILCMLIDCLRVERDEWVKSEMAAGPVLEKHIAQTQGKVIVTLMSSHIHRIQQTVDAAVKHGRKLVFVGRSVEQNVEVALQLKKLRIPAESLVHKRDLDQHADDKLCVVIAGSQGQEGSSLVRAISGDHPVLQIKERDKVIFSADAIPGNEIPYYQAIDVLSRNRVDVIYPDVEPEIHQSGHASAPEQQELLSLVKPKYVMPIGGADRHRFRFVHAVAEIQGYDRQHVLVPEHGQVIEFIDNSAARLAERIQLQALTVDGLGIGDVGPIVLSDRLALAQAGMVVLVIPKVAGKFELSQLQVVSRGFVFMKEAEDVVEFIKRSTAEILDELGPKAKDDEVRRAIEKRLARKLHKVIAREPMILPVIVNL